MKIELRKIKTFDGMEGTGYNADVLINGKNVGQAIDDGNGGGVCLRFYNKVGSPLRKLTEEAEAWAQTLPDKEFEYQGRTLKVKSTLESIVDNLFEDHMDAKDKAKMERAGKKYIQYGVPKGFSYSQISWKGKTLEQMAATPQGRLTLQVKINQIKKGLKPNEVILNGEYLKSLGLTL